MESARPAKPRFLRSLNLLTTLLTVSFLFVTLLSPTFTIMPVYLAARALSQAASVDDWASQFLSSYMDQLSFIVPLPLGDTSSLSIPVQVHPSVFRNSSGNLSTFTVSQRGNFLIISKGKNTPDSPDNLEQKSWTYFVERFWWPPIEAVRIAYLTLSIFAGFMGIFMLVLSGRRRHQTPKSASPEAWSYP